MDGKGKTYLVCLAVILSMLLSLPEFYQERSVNAAAKKTVNQEPPVHDDDFTVAVVILVDVSGSMDSYWVDGIKMDSARDAAHGMLDLLEAENAILGRRYMASLVKFESEATLVQPMTSNFALLRHGVDNLYAKGATNIGDGLEKALQQFSGIAYDRAFVVLLSDGMTNRGRTAGQILAWLETEDTVADGPPLHSLQASLYGYRDRILGFYYHGRIKNVEYAGKLLDEAGYDSLVGVHESSHLALERLPADLIFFFRGHANDETLAFYDADGTKTFIFSSNIRNTSLPGLRLVVLTGCQTAGNVQNRNNILRSFIDSGAMVGIGFLKNISTFNATTWSDIFWDRFVNQGFTVNEAGLAGTWTGRIKAPWSRGLRRDLFVAFPAAIAREVTLDDMKPVYEVIDSYPELEPPRVYTIGFGNPGDLDENLLQAIADATEGEYLYGGQTWDLANIFVRTHHHGTGVVRAEFSGTIKQGEELTAGSFNLERGESELRVALNWPGSEVALQIIDPRGNLVDAGYNGVRTLRTERPAYAVIDRPRSGEWSVKVYGTDIPEEGSSYYVVASTADIAAALGGGIEFLLVLAALVLAGLLIMPRITGNRPPQRRSDR